MNPKGCAIASPRGSRIPERDSRTPKGDIEPITPKDEVALWHYYMAYFSFYSVASRAVAVKPETSKNESLPLTKEPSG